MIEIRYFCFLSAALFLPAATFGGSPIYKSVDDAGHVSYSAEPPTDAATTEELLLRPGPSAEEADEAVERARATEQQATARFQERMERRRQEAQERAEARQAAESRRLETEAADRQRRIDDSLRQLTNGPPYYYRYPGHGDWLYPPRPGHPGYVPRPPRPTHPLTRPNKPYRSHINTPARNW